MKKLLLLVVLTSSLNGIAQNYQCLQPGVKHYFINGNGYLRGIRIDSVGVTGDTIVYYPFFMRRGEYDIVSGSSLWSGGGSWLGGRVLQLSNGTFIFDDNWNDSIVIRTQAHVGDNWTFYKDSGHIYYKATVIGVDTMTVLSHSDSVKKIMINAYDTASMVATDPLDSFMIILSKNNGFVQVFDLFMFPYHKPDSAYRPGLDFYLDRSTCTYQTIITTPGNQPDKKNAIFRLTNFINPTRQQLYNWSAGDVIKSGHSYGLAPMSASYYSESLWDSVSGETTSGHTRIDTVVGSTGTCSYPLYYFTCHFICPPGVSSFQDNVYAFLDTTGMPEEMLLYTLNYFFYFPDDTTYCCSKPAYASVPPLYSPVSLSFGFEWTKYKLGIGMTDYYHYDDNVPNFESTTLVSYKIGGAACPVVDTTTTDTTHTFVYAVSTGTHTVRIFPNPAVDELTVQTASQLNTITITNMLGITLTILQTAKQEEKISTAGLPAGIYNVSVIDGDGSRHSERVTIIH